MKRMVMFLAILMSVFCFLNISQAVKFHSNGWVYPAGIHNLNGGAGWRPNFYKIHIGFDYMLPIGSPVKAIADGEVFAYDNKIGGYGSWCEKDKWNGSATLLKHQAKDTQGNIITFYAVYGHATTRSDLKVGDKVKAGEIIAYVHGFYGSYDDGKTCSISWTL